MTLSLSLATVCWRKSLFTFILFSITCTSATGDYDEQKAVLVV